MANLSKGLAVPGKTLKDLWRARGLSEEEVERRHQERLDKIVATRARTMAKRLEMKALAMGLGQEAYLAKVIDKKHQEITREFRASPLRGVRSQAAIQRKLAKDKAKEDKRRDYEFNPKIKGLTGLKGITTEEDGSIRLQELRKQRPYIFYMMPKGLTSIESIRRIHELLKAEGRKDKYGQFFN